MFEVGFSEIVLILGLALLVLGPEKLPGLAEKVGRWTGRARSMARQLRTQLEQEVTLEELAKSRPVQTAPPQTPPPQAEPVHAAPLTPAEPTPTTSPETQREHAFDLDAFASREDSSVPQHPINDSNGADSEPAAQKTHTVADIKAAQ